MNNLISKELMSLVMGINVVELDTFDNDIHFNYYLVLDKHTKRNDVMSKDTLLRLYKEWCLEQGYEVESALYKYHDGLSYGRATIYYKPCSHKIIDDIVRTELEAVSKATEWAAKEKGLLNRI